MSKSVKKNAMLEALKKSLGNVATACKKTDLSRQTHYNYMRDDEDYAAKVEDMKEVAIDFVESKLLEKINGVKMVKQGKDGPAGYTLPPSDTAIIFYLKTQAKHRGYVERQEVTGKDGEDLYRQLSDEQLNQEIDKIGKDTQA